MVIRVTLQFEKKVVCDELRGVPRVRDLHWLVHAILHLSKQAIVLEVVHSLELREDYDVCKEVESQTLASKHQIDHTKV